MAMSLRIPKLSAEQQFMASVLLVNAGNYLYNLLLGRILGPELFADAALMITLLLVVSFMAMTFQLATAKFSVLFEKQLLRSFLCKVYNYGIGIGLVLGLLLILFSTQLQEIFQTQSSMMFVIFGCGIPIYFAMSINRGVYQGSERLGELSKTYYGEMLSRLAITIVLLLLVNGASSVMISIGIVASLLLGLVPFDKESFNSTSSYTLPKEQSKQVSQFFLLTAFYELTQIIINNSDILLVKSYFEEYEAGLYASLALIGRVVYFVAWMFVMLLLPKVVQLRKEHKPYTQVLYKYVAYITGLSCIIVFACYLLPELIIQMMFGIEYLSMAPLLWKYAIATSLFAIANIFAYYFLSLDQYAPVIISGVLGSSQVLLIVLFHDSLAQVVTMQIMAMGVLLIAQLCYFFYSNYTKGNRSKDAHTRGAI